MNDIKLITERHINNLKEWFKYHSGNANGVIIGISGGKDSTVVAKLCCDAIGKDKVFGVLMPHTTDINDESLVYGKKVCEYLGIKHRVVNISNIVQFVENQINFGDEDKFCLSKKTKTNIPPRIRMTCLYAMGQEIGYRVIGTSNLSEITIGWFTKWGDNANDYSPIVDLTKSEVVEMGRYLKIPDKFIDKEPADGMTGKTDEDNFGFTYKLLDDYIRHNLTDEDIVKYNKEINKIDKMKANSKHKIK